MYLIIQLGWKHSTFRSVTDTCLCMYLRPLKQTLALNPPLVTLHRISNLALIPQNLICVSWRKCLGKSFVLSPWLCCFLFFMLCGAWHAHIVNLHRLHMHRYHWPQVRRRLCGLPVVTVWGISASRALACVWWRCMGCCCMDVTTYSGLGKPNVII